MQQHLHYSNFKATQVEKVNAEAVVGQMLFLNQTLEPLLSYLKVQDIFKRLETTSLWKLKDQTIFSEHPVASDIAKENQVNSS